MAQGDSWADPIIVDNWADFLTNNVASKYVKFANPSRTITGDGSSGNPWVVSTYDEMLTKTGATYIYQVKLIDREAKKYKYGDVYCIYDDSLTTIDFNNEPTMPEGGYTSDLKIEANVDFNGWTLKNITMNRCTFRMTKRNKNARISNLLVYGYFSGSAFYLDAGCEHFIVSMHVNNDSGNTQTAIYTPTNELYGWTSGSLSLRCTGKVAVGIAIFINTTVNLNVNSSQFTMQSTYFKNALVTGDVVITDTSVFSIGHTINNSIFDFNHTGTETITVYSSVNSVSVYNSDKFSVTPKTNLIGVDTATLKSASDLADVGFPIGVD